MNRPDDAQHEPSMEDILTSIRRILSEEGGEEEASDAHGESAPREAEASRGEPDADQFKPRRTVGEARQTEGGRRNLEFDEDDMLADTVLREGGTAPRPTGPADADGVLDLTPEMRVSERPGMVSSSAASQSTDVLAHLAKAVLDHRDISIASSGVTLEGMVRQMLRPLLKEWLDRNLPYLIERLVKREIDMMINRAERLED